MSKRMTATLVCDALKMALFRRKLPQGVIVHSDRGSQYCSHDFQRLLRANQLLCSMSAKGNCYDNTCAESFFHSLKVEAIHGETFATRASMSRRCLSTLKRSIMLSAGIAIMIKFHLGNLNRIFTRSSLLKLSTIHGVDQVRRSLRRSRLCLTPLSRFSQSRLVLLPTHPGQRQAATALRKLRSCALACRCPP